jgi:hypothetical protein
MVSGMGASSRVRVYVVEGYGLELMAFYMFTCPVLKSMLSMNFGTSQRAHSCLIRCKWSFAPVEMNILIV